MAEPAVAGHAGPAAPTSTLSVPWIVLAGVVIGVGLFGTAYWLVTFDWLYFLSLVPLVLGAYLLFTRATGADHA